MSEVWQVTVTIYDDKDDKSNHKFYLRTDDYPDHQSAVAYISAYALALNYLVGGEIYDITLQRERLVDGGTPDTGSDVEEKLKVIYNVNGSSKKIRQTIATWSEDFLFPDPGDETRRPTFDPEVTAWRNLMAVAPSLGFPSNPSDIRGAVIDSFDDAYVKFKRRKERSKRRGT